MTWREFYSFQTDIQHCNKLSSIHILFINYLPGIYKNVLSFRRHEYMTIQYVIIFDIPAASMM